jgi:DNA-binding MarR family transcriptional regulator
MVKSLDDHSTQPIDHVGLDLWRAASAWRARLHREMVARGHTWYGDARGAVAQSLDVKGLSQSDLVLRMGISKQAVQQVLDGLEAEGIIRREPDPDDRRGKRVVYTAEGLRAVRDANVIKRALERELRARIGSRAVDELRRALGEVTQALEKT